MATTHEVTIDARSFTTLVAAVTAASLGETLCAPGPFTGFAPTDDALTKMPTGTVEGLLNDIPTLTKILTHHIISGKIMAAEAAKLTSAKLTSAKTVKPTAQHRCI